MDRASFVGLALTLILNHNRANSYISAKQDWPFLVRLIHLVQFTLDLGGITLSLNGPIDDQYTRVYFWFFIFLHTL